MTIALRRAKYIVHCFADAPTARSFPLNNVEHRGRTKANIF